MKATLNIGLAIGRTKQFNTVREVLLVLRAFHVSVLRYRVAESTTEPTVVLEVCHALSPNKAWEVAAVLGQDCIAQEDIERNLELYGPKAADRQPANPDYFITF